MTKHEQVAQRVLALIENGLLGTRIPSVRAMARQMGVSPMTVLEGYHKLEDRGIIESRPQSGYYVCSAWSNRTGIIPPPARLEAIRPKAHSVRIPDGIRELLVQTMNPNLLPLGSGAASPEFFPNESLSLRMARAVRTNPEETNRTLLGPGDPSLRTQLARRMVEAGCSVDPSEILVTLGATEGLHLCLRAIAQPGDLIGVESPGYYGFYAALENLGLKALEIPSDPQTGISLPALKEALNHGIKGLLLCPTLSNPTGATIPDAAKEELVRLKIPIIEDDAYGELAFAGQRARALKSFAPENVLYVGSLSKVLCPGYRLGWVAGGKHQEALMRHHLASIMAVPTPTQKAAASFLTDGGMPHHLRRLRKQYREGMIRFQEAIAAWSVEVRTSQPLGGHFLWVELPDGCEAIALAEETSERGFSIAPGALFTSQSRYGRFFRLNAAIPWGDSVQGALATLGALVQRMACS